jgi:hypothetical protein
MSANQTQEEKDQAEIRALQDEIASLTEETKAKREAAFRRIVIEGLLRMEIRYEYRLKGKKEGLPYYQWPFPTRAEEEAYVAANIEKALAYKRPPPPTEEEIKAEEAARRQKQIAQLKEQIADLRTFARN